MTDSMRAVRFADGGPTLADVDRPVGEGAVVTVTAAGICGSDVATAGQGASPWVPGHEIVGLLPDGTAVAVQPNLSCGTCARCRAGAGQQCGQSLELFLGVNGLDGGFAEQVVVDPRLARPLPAGMSHEVAALTEPAAVALHAVARLGAPDQAPVLVLGAGTIGLLAAAQLTDRGHAVSLVARHAHQAELGEAAGASIVTPDEARSLAVDAVLDTAGSQSAVDIGYDAAAPGGRIVSVGAAGWAVRTSQTALIKELSLVGSVIYADDDFDAAITWLDGRTPFAERLVTHRFALDDAAEAFAVASDKSSGSVKVLLHP